MFRIEGRLYPVIILLIVAILGISWMATVPSNESDLWDKRGRGINTTDVDIEKLLNTLSLRQKVAQLMIVWSPGEFASEDAPRYRRIAELIRTEQIGGLIMSSTDVYGQAMMTRRFQEISPIPLWITQDMETGAAMRISGTTRFPNAMGVAATGKPRFNYEIGRITALESQAVGVHQIFAPVVDVNNNPDNPVINTRSYSEDPEIVSKFASAFIEGAQNVGVMATAKHFPGHGDTNIDSHLGLPVIDHDFNKLDQVELVPFRSAISAGVGSIMTAHIAFPKLGVEPNRPGTLDRNIITGILRDSLNFNGIVITDALEMQGIRNNYGPGEAAVLAIQAGADLILIPDDIHEAINAVEKAVLDGKIDISHIDRLVKQFLKLKKSYGLFDRNYTPVDELPARINTLDHRMIADQISRESITLLKNRNQIVPIRPGRYARIAVISVSDDRTGNTGAALASTIREYHPDVRFHVFDTRTSVEEIEQIVRSVRQSDLIILGSFVFVRTSNDIELSNRQRQFIRRIESLRKPTVAISFGNPYIVKDLEFADVHMQAWSPGAGQMHASAHALFGASDINGKLPVTIPGMYKRGDGLSIDKTVLRKDYPELVGMKSDTLTIIDSVIRNAIRNEVFPGATVAVIKDGIITYQKAFGYHDYTKRERTRVTDVFDLASLTKVMATTISVMKLVSDGNLSLNDPVSRFIPEFRDAEKKDVTIYHLLTHTSGLPAFRVYVDQIRDRKTLLRAIKNEPLINSPGDEYVYSDLGMIILAEIVEQVTGQSIDSYLDRTFFRPLGMNMTTFNPNRRAIWFRNRVLPTEIDTIYRKSRVQGVVHDERAYFLDGIAGHAGLFSNVVDVGVFAALLMNQGEYAGIRFIDRDVVSTFTQRQAPHNRRALGFDMKTLEGFSSAGSLASERTYGHTGFTGTSLWIDPEINTAVILLTNRTYPYRGSATQIGQVRAEIADIVHRSISKTEESE